MADKKKPSVKKAAPKKTDNSISEQLEIALAAYKPQVGEKKFKHIIKKTAKLIKEGIAKTEKKKKKVVVKKKLVPKKAAKKVAVKKPEAK